MNDSTLTPIHIQYDFNEGGAYGKTGVILTVKPNRPLNYSDSQTVQNSVSFNSIPLAYNGAGNYIKITNIFIPDVSTWVTIKLRHANDTLKVYFNDSLLHKYPFIDSIYRIFKFQSIFYSSIESGSIDYIKVYDKDEKLQYAEEFEDCKQSASNMPPSFMCSGDCHTSFTAYYNTGQGTSYSFSQIDSIYLLACGVHPGVCSDTAITAGRLKQVQKDFYAKYLNPENDFVDLDMRTFSGNKTPDEAPKGVFDINKI